MVIFLGWGLEVRVAVRSISFNVIYPEEAVNKTEGLLGVYNKNPSDDLKPPTGQTLPPKSSERTIFTEFGQKCESKLQPHLYLKQKPC